MGLFRSNDETNNVNEHNMVKNSNWQEVDQLAIYKHDRRVELGSTEKQLQLSGQSGTWTRDLQTDFKSGALTTRPYCLLVLDFTSVLGMILHIIERIHQIEWSNIQVCYGCGQQGYGWLKTKWQPCLHVRNVYRAVLRPIQGFH